MHFTGKSRKPDLSDFPPHAGSKNREGKSLGSHLASRREAQLAQGKKRVDASISSGTNREEKGGKCFPPSNRLLGKAEPKQKAGCWL